MATALGPDAMYALRRGWTHGVLAMLALPLLLAGAVKAWDTWRGGEGEAADFKRLLALSTLGIWSHPALDWLNTYGVRLGMPFSDTWFYGDALFILDPWMWLSAGAGVVMARSAARRSQLAWAVLALALCGPMFLVPTVPLVSQIVWGAGLLAIGGARLLRPGRASVVARLGLSALGVYIASQVGITQSMKGKVESHVTPELGSPESVFAGPLPARPFTRDIVAVYPEVYRFYRLSVGGPVEVWGEPILRGRSALTEAAMGAEALAGFAHWSRFPAFEVTPEGEGHRVRVHDVRYSRMDGAGIGRADVLLSAEGEVLEVTLPRQ